jgi:hypothetical protein
MDISLAVWRCTNATTQLLIKTMSNRSIFRFYTIQDSWDYEINYGLCALLMLTDGLFSKLHDARS